MEKLLRLPFLGYCFLFLLFNHRKPARCDWNPINCMFECQMLETVKMACWSRRSRFSEKKCRRPPEEEKKRAVRLCCALCLLKKTFFFSGSNPANWDMDFFLGNDFYEQNSRARPVLRVLGSFLGPWSPKLRGHKTRNWDSGIGSPPTEPLRARP